jgi:hypothetical protein
MIQAGQVRQADSRLCDATLDGLHDNQTGLYIPRTQTRPTSAEDGKIACS